MSIEKVNMLKSFGAEVIITPTDVPGDSPQHYVNVAKRVATETPNAFYVDQYHNKLNTEAHYLSTGREIWEQTQGKFDAFVAGTGTGGTTSGAARYLKEKNKGIKVIGVDPFGSVHFDIFYSGKIVTPPHVYKVEGLGEDIKCEAFDPTPIDEMRQVNDAQCFEMGRRLVREEGIFCGGSSGGNVHIAVEIAKEMGPGKTVITVLPDSASRYITKYLSDSWMVDNGFLPRENQKRSLGTVGDILKLRKRDPITARESDKVGDVIARMQSEKISQLPLIASSGIPQLIVHEIDILRGLTSQNITNDSPVSLVGQRIVGIVELQTPSDELFPIFDKNNAAIVVDNGNLVGIITEIDVVEYLSRAN
ncbi:MAG: pyridoxal-phosphate dependent enzyme [Bdellovibrionales bacterium]|nr:pyridoxal-phosphate dependent enzyme [Bdellovibrionales bacterium]